MPQLGETVTEGTITKWHKQVGDAIEEDEVLFEVSTDKVDSEVPSPVTGTVTEILVPEGETVSVGTKLAVIGQPGQASGTGNGAAGATAANGAAQALDGVEQRCRLKRSRSLWGPPKWLPKAPQAKVPPAGPLPPTATRRRRLVAVAGRRARALRRPAKPPVGGTPRPGSRPADQRPPSAPAQGGPSKLLSPVVRRLIAEHGLDPAEIPGSGAGGRITRDDVLAAIERQGSNGAGPAADDGAGEKASAGGTRGRVAAAPEGAGAPVPSVVAAGPVPVAGEGDTIVPFTNIRRRTAEHMVRSKHTSAHTVVAVEVDYSAVERARLAEREHFKATEGFSLTYLPFISRAVVDALEEWPYLNSSVGDDQLIVHGEVNLGIAVDLDFEGLLVPVVHRAEEKRLVALARGDLRAGVAGAFETPHHGRHCRGHLYHHQRRRFRDAVHGPSDQPTASGDLVNRRGAQATGGHRVARRLRRHRHPSRRQPGVGLGPPCGGRRLCGRLHGQGPTGAGNPRLGRRALSQSVPPSPKMGHLIPVRPTSRCVVKRRVVERPSGVRSSSSPGSR